MPGAILQLVANSGPQNIWIDHNPQITFFKTIFRRHTPFSTETIPLPFNGTFDFGKTAVANIARKGDLVHRAFVTFDIPELAAIFPNTKTEDLAKLVLTTKFTDTDFMDKIKKYITGSPEIAPILSMVEDTLKLYSTEQIRRINILSEMDAYYHTINPDQTTRTNTTNRLDYLDGENFGPINKIYRQKDDRNDLTELKMEITGRWLVHKKEYLPFYELVKFIYLSQYSLLKDIPLIGTKNINQDLVVPYVFRELLPSPDIFVMHHRRISQNTIPSGEKIGHGGCDMGRIVDDNWHDFGPELYDMLNTYNGIINVLKMLGKTVPIVISKAYVLSDTNANIYHDHHPTHIIEKNFPTIIDPNFRRSFMQMVNNINNITDFDILPVDFGSIYDQIYPNEYMNGYLKLFNDQATSMFNNIQAAIDRLFEIYHGRIFCSTDHLFYRNSTPLTNIYAYLAPTDGYLDSAIYRPKNVFNANIYLFYFFKYLDMLNPRSLAEYLVANTCLPAENANFLVNLVSLAKINISYYMTEISYMMNDLYAKSPSANPDDSMKNYTPQSYAPAINGYNVHTDLLAVTAIFHRNHIPSILEIFQFIYYFIDKITLEQINEYLCTEMVVAPNEIILAKNIAKIVYSQIFKYFMDIYDDFKFEAAASMANVGITTGTNSTISDYLRYFINGTGTAITDQPTISPYLAQMEFYFVLEMINMRSIQKFYYNLLQNRELISTYVGGTSIHILDTVIQYFRSLDDIDITNLHNVAEYWDYMYQHNIRAMKNDRLYYSTFTLNRYSGEPYLYTPYRSRFYGQVDGPVQDPLVAPTIPYGVDPSYYDNTNIGHILVDEIPIHWTNPVKLYSTIDNSEPKFKMYPIDFYRIKHEIFHHPTNQIDHNIKFIDEYQFSILAFNRMARQLRNKCTPYLLQWLRQILQYILTNTDPGVYYSAINKQEKNISETLHMYLVNVAECIELSAHGEKKIVGPTMEIINGMVQISDTMLDLFGRELPLQLYNQAEPYGHHQLLENNKYVTNYVFNFHFSNIIYAIILLRDNFLSQYYYYQKYQEEIRYIYNNTFSANSTGTYIKNILGDRTINDIAFVYPSIFPRDMRKVFAQNNDFYMAVLKFLYPLDNGVGKKLSLVDILDYINMVYTATTLLYCRLLESNIYQYVLNKFEYYQPMMLSKLSMVCEMESIIQKEISTSEKNAQMVKIAKTYGVYNNDFMLFTEHLLKNGNARNILPPDRNKLDHFLLSKNFKMHQPTFREQILSDLADNDTLVGDYDCIAGILQWIDNDILPYVYFYLKFVHQNKIDISELPHQSTIQYDGRYVTDGLEYLMDHIMDKIIHIGANTNSEHFDYGLLFSALAKNIYDAKIDSADLVDDIIAKLDRTSEKFGGLIRKLELAPRTNDNYINNFYKKSSIIALNRDMASKGILQLQQQIRELSEFKNQIINILYRQRTSRTAWTHRLAHYLVKNVEIQCGGTTIDTHISDWFEVFNQISQNPGLASGYNKMIGHRDDLINYSTAPKSSYCIALPLIFYWNKYISHSIPLVASTNVQYQVKIELRDLDDVAYKERFAEFVDPSSGKMVQPKIKNAQLMVEYIYLSSEERKIFFSRHLEYIIDELQYETDVNISNTVPIYKTRNNTYVDIDCGQDLLVPRNDYIVVPYQNPNGVQQWITKRLKIPVGPYVHYNKFVHRYYFNNPAKMLFVLVKPVIHTDPSMRTDENSYFYGEKQWDNYGLYSYYDLSKINGIKLAHYNDLRRRLDDIDDPKFGFIAVLDRVLTSTTDENMFQILQQIKEAYLEYNGPIYDSTAIQRAKYMLYGQNTEPDICDINQFDKMVIEICNILGTPNDVRMDKPPLPITRAKFRLYITKLLEKYIYNRIMTAAKLETVIDSIYRRYARRQIDLFVNSLDTYVGLNNFTLKSLKYYLTWYIVSEPNDLARKILSNLECNNIIPRQILWLDVIQQLVNIDSKTLGTITVAINNKLNEIINEHYANNIDYRDYLVKNPEINPVISGHFTINTVPIMPENSDNKFLSEIPAYINFKNTPATGVNMHSWALNPLLSQPSGSVNLGAVADFTAIYNIHPLIGTNYPATMTTMVSSINIMRYLSGMCGKMWLV